MPWGFNTKSLNKLLDSNAAPDQIKAWWGKKLKIFALGAVIFYVNGILAGGFIMALALHYFK